MSKAVRTQTYKKGEELPQWVLTQKKTFTNWCNQYLKPEDALADLATDFQSGIKLILLVESLTNGSVGKYNQKPRMRVHLLENSSKALKFIQAQGIKLVGIGPEDVVDGDVKLILGLVWMLIQHRYALLNRESGVDVNLKNDLLTWIRRKVQPYPVTQPSNFKQSWQDGKVLCALVDSLKNLSTKDKDFSFDKRTGKPIDDVKAAIDWAAKNLDVPAILDPLDMVEFPDELSNITYLAAFLKYATQEPDPTDASKSSVSNWKKFVVDTPSSFSIVACKENGQQQPQGGDFFKIGLVGPNGVEYAPQVNDNQNGTYDVSFVPTKVGKLLGSVAMGEASKTLKGTPLHTFVVPACQVKFEAYGPGLTHGHAKRPLSFNMKISDQDGNPLEIPVDCIEAIVQSPSTVTPVLIKPCEKGIYEANYQLATSGEYSVICNLFGDEVARYPLSCHDAINLSLITTSLFGDGIDGGELPEHPVKFVAELKSGNKPLPVNLNDVSFKVVGPFDDIVPTVTLNSPGNFTVEYFPKVMGDYDITLSVHGGRLTDAHPSFTIGGLKCVLSGPGVKGGCIKRPLKFKVGFYDSNGKVAGSAFKALDTDNSGKLEKDEVLQFIQQVSIIPKVREMFDKLLGEYTGPSENKASALVDVVFEKFDADKSGDITLEEFRAWGSAVPFIETLFAVTSGKIEVKITGPDSSLAPSVKESTTEPGTFDVEYQPKQPGKYNIDVIVNHRSVIGDAVVAHCFESDFHPQITGAGIDKPAYTKRGLENVFTILGDDQKPIDVPLPLLSISLAGPSALNTPLEPQGRGSFATHYSTAEPGDYQLQVSAFGEPLLDKPIVLSIKDRKPTSPDQSKVILKDEFVENKPAVFQIVANADDGTPQDVGGDVFNVKLEGDKNTEFLASLEDKDDGKYEVHFTPTVFGKMKIKAALQDKLLKDNPLTAYVLPAVPYSANAYGKGLEPGYRGYPQRFFAELLDSTNHTNIKVPNDCFNVTIAGPNADEVISPTITPTGESGTFEISYIPTHVGDYAVNLQFFGKPAWDVPVVVPITEKPATSALNSHFTELDNFVVNVPMSLVVMAKTNEDVQQKVGGDQFDVKLVDADALQLPVVLEDGGDGTYTANFTPTKIGKLDVEAKLNGENIKDTPTSTFVVPAWSNTGSSITGPSEGFTFIPTVFNVSVWGDTKEDVLPIPPDCFSVTSPDLHKAPRVTTTAQSAQDYTVAVTIDEEGNYPLTFSLFGKPLDKPRPVSITKKHPALLCSVVFSQGIENTVVREPTTFQVVAKDVHGQPVVGAQFSVSIKGPKLDVAATVKDLQNGTYEVTYKPKEAGKLKIAVKLDGVDVVGSPFGVYAIPNDSIIAMIKGKGCFRGSAHEKLSFEIEAFLQSGAYKKAVPLSAVSVQITGPEEVKPTITPSTKKGYFTVYYSVSTPGIYLIKAQLFGREIGQAEPEIVAKDKYKKQ